MEFGTVMNKQIRGYILKVCKIDYPRPVGSNIIDVCLLDAGMHTSPSQLEGHLKYLQERGYVTLNRVGISGMGAPIILVTLTAQGIDLLEETISDQGVCFDAGR